ncbi:hypothetical protein Ccrd_009259 [Cynara cardunculus var. scolymus]|uniref:Uncharacterized protein n=1 Tax=Cynara cardunculus var. scolymus TaxID=59895 RepID=A0A103YNE7_CYNCS|nr:hypothetical protein Ccrd_009259 [Cynara cardunculus var. scolymus]
MKIKTKVNPKSIFLIKKNPKETCTSLPPLKKLQGCNGWQVSTAINKAREDMDIDSWAGIHFVTRKGLWSPEEDEKLINHNITSRSPAIAAGVPSLNLWSQIAEFHHLYMTELSFIGAGAA